MDITADNLVNQIAETFISKVDRQELNPQFLEKFFNSILEKVTFKGKGVITQEDKKTEPPPPSKQLSFTEQFKQALENIVKDKALFDKVTEKLFNKSFSDALESIKQPKDTSLPKETKASQTPTLTQPELPNMELPEATPPPLPETPSNENKQNDLLTTFLTPLKSLTASLNDLKKDKNETFKPIIQQKEEPKEVIITEVNDKVLEKLPKVLKGLIPKQEKAKKESTGGLLEMLGLPGAAVLKGGVAVLGVVGGALAALYSLQDTGPFKGLMKMVGSGVLQLGLKTLFKSFVKKVPIIGALISVGSAVSRLLQGDFIGAGIDVISAIGNLVMLTGVGVPVGMGIMLAADALNAFLDFQTGGIGEGKPSKGGAILGVLKKMGGWVGSLFKNIPIIGPLIKAVEAFSKEDYEAGVKQLFYINPVFELIGSLLFGDKETTAVTKGFGAGLSIIGNLVKWIGKMLYRGIKMLPIIGPAIKAIEAFVDGDYMKGLKQLVYINPMFEFLGALMGDKEASGVTKTGASIVRLVGSITKWAATTIYKGIKMLPIIGPAIKAIEEFMAGNFKSGFKQLLYINPIFDLLGAFLGDKEVTGFSKVTKAGINFISNAIKWVAKTAYNGFKALPIIGPLIKAVENFAAGEYKAGFKQLLYVNPIFEFFGALMGDTETTGIASGIADTAKGIAGALPNFFNYIRSALIRKLLSFVPKKILGISVRSRVAKILGVKEDGSSINDDVDTADSEGDAGSDKDPTPMAKGGVVTKPTNAIVGEKGPEAVIPLNKYFGGIMEKMKEAANNAALDKIADNTGNTNDSLKSLSQALYRLVVMLDKKLSNMQNTTVVNAGSSGGKEPTPASFVANNNNDPIRAIRMQFA